MDKADIYACLKNCGRHSQSVKGNAKEVAEKLKQTYYPTTGLVEKVEPELLFKALETINWPPENIDKIFLVSGNEPTNRMSMETAFLYLLDKPTVTGPVYRAFVFNNKIPKNTSKITCIDETIGHGQEITYPKLSRNFELI